MSWTGSTSSTQLTSITTEQFFSQTPTLQPNEIAHVQVAVDFPASPTEDAIVSVYATVDGTNWDNVPFMTALLPRTLDPARITFGPIYGVYQFRVGVKRSGSSMTITSADMRHRIGS